MHNVHAPLDIAFLDAGGNVLEVQLMKPYAVGTEPVYYRPARPYRAALEAQPGQLMNARPVRVEWSGN
jgi:uncharacterized membrane protein (UPF0127 family)